MDRRRFLELTTLSLLLPSPVIGAPAATTVVLAVEGMT